MALRLIAPAPVAAVAAMMAATGLPTSMRKFTDASRGAATLVLRGFSWAAIDEQGHALATWGAAAEGERFEGWILAAPDLAAPRMLGVLRLAQLTLRQIVQDGAVVFTRVAKGNRSGQRIVRFLGMARTGERHGYEIWERI